MMTKRIGTIQLLGTLTLLAFLGGSALAGEPKKRPLGSYAELWTPGKSAFTVPPPVVVEEKVEESPLDDYSLAGVAKLKEGWFVVLINKKKKDERLRLKPDVPSKEGYQVVNVEHGDGYLATKVEIKTRSGKTAWVEYDKAAIALKKANPRAQPGNPAAGQPPVPQRPGAPPQPAANGQPPVPTGNASNNRGSRVRRIPTPPTR